jgi:hypothetical protein
MSLISTSNQGRVDLRAFENLKGPGAVRMTSQGTLEVVSKNEVSKQESTAVREAFVDALKQRDSAAVCFEERLTSPQKMAKPLSTRKVAEILQQAKSLQNESDTRTVKQPKRLPRESNGDQQKNLSVSTPGAKPGGDRAPFSVYVPSQKKTIIQRDFVPVEFDDEKTKTQEKRISVDGEQRKQPQGPSLDVFTTLKGDGAVRLKGDRAELVKASKLKAGDHGKARAAFLRALFNKFPGAAAQMLDELLKDHDKPLTTKDINLIVNQMDIMTLGDDDREVSDNDVAPTVIRGPMAPMDEHAVLRDKVANFSSVPDIKKALVRNQLEAAWKVAEEKLKEKNLPSDKVGVVVEWTVELLKGQKDWREKIGECVDRAINVILTLDVMAPVFDGGDAPSGAPPKND